MIDSAQRAAALDGVRRLAKLVPEWTDTGRARQEIRLAWPTCCGQIRSCCTGTIGIVTCRRARAPSSTTMRLTGMPT